ncbi:MAG: DUF5067 domain-containing protein [Oscillospiraceae bacterium]|nr:DUF5067 domain-containing protein [Oscillospiraceae bacterium]
MKKILAAAFAIICTMTMFTACYNDDKSHTTQAITQTAVSNKWNATYNKCSIRLEGADLVYDYDGDPIIVVEMTFRNDSDKSRSCGYTFSVDAYQDGIECDTAFLWGENSEKYDTGTNTTDIKPGVEFTVYKAYMLRDETNRVDIEVKGFLDLSNEILFAKIYNL